MKKLFLTSIFGLALMLTSSKTKAQVITFDATTTGIGSFKITASFVDPSCSPSVSYVSTATAKTSPFPSCEVLEWTLEDLSFSGSATTFTFPSGAFVYHHPNGTDYMVDILPTNPEANGDWMVVIHPL